MDQKQENTRRSLKYPAYTGLNCKYFKYFKYSASRIATKNHLVANDDHFHDDTNIILVKQHNLLIAKQYSVKFHIPEHLQPKLSAKISSKQ